MTVLSALDSLSAAKDIGTAKDDKKRKERLLELARKAAVINALTPAESYPEVSQATKLVAELGTLTVELDELSVRLRMAPQASMEAAQSQKALDRVRGNIDVMLPSLTVAMNAMEHILKGATATEKAIQSLKTDLDSLMSALQMEKTRLASAAQAVENAAKLG